MDVHPDQKKTCNELLIDCLEHFGACEPHSALVVWVDEDGIINWRFNMPGYQVMGLMQIAMNIISIQCLGKMGAK